MNNVEFLDDSYTPHEEWETARLRVEGLLAAYDDLCKKLEEPQDGD